SSPKATFPFGQVIPMAVSADQKTRQLYGFGPFRVDPEKELLLREGEAVPLAPKAFQVLLVLMRHSKQVVSKDDLLKTIWPDTFVEEANLSRNIFLLRKVLGESPQDHQYIVTVPGRGYRFAEDVQLVPEQPVSIVAAQHSTVQVQVKETKPRGWLSAAAILLLIIAGVASWLVLRRKPVLSEKDTVVLADFANSTGDPVFDGTLRQGLAVQLEQSPFLSLISDARIQQTLRLMDQPPDARLTPEIAREICERTGSAAVLDGSIAEIGTRYLLTLNAARCSSGELLASGEAQASNKNHVLDALGNMASDIRNKLGESLSTAQKFDTPLEQATTPSLEALHAYSLGRRAMSGRGDWSAAVPFFLRAVSLDPNFAIAYARLGMAYRNLGQTTLGAENAQKAYQLRVRASESERFYIDSHYYMIGVSDLEKARQVLELWAQTYPRDMTPRADLSDLYANLGGYDKALAEAREGAGLDANGVMYAEIASSDICLNRLQEAGSVVEATQAKQLDSPTFHLQLYQLAFLRNDASGMAQQVAWAAAKPGAEDVVLELEADSKAYFGQLGKARGLSSRAVESAEQAEKREVAAGYQAEAAFREAVYGNPLEARSGAKKALALSNGREVEYEAALALALAGDAPRARTLTDDLARRFPEDTIVQFIFLPALRAQLALSTNDSSEALDAIQSAAPYELGTPRGSATTLYPVYVRGEAYLAARRGPEAAAEFQRILDHPGIVLNSPIAALAHLHLARAYAVSGDSNDAREQYREFLALWKNADQDLPVLRRAKAEYAKLQKSPSNDPAEPPQRSKTEH
ncbi:MAG TPA: winged helix-turn-helix domain-containing protein, partial [Terracidiphilus sp.]|nr:winged helix-turn-helix domain-containing protein [Terracidiphilus sp.]